MTEKTEIWNPRTYDSLRRQLIPSFDRLYDSAASAVAMTVRRAPYVLDLGAGTGLLSIRVLELIPNARLVLLDRSEGMLGQARQRFAGRDGVEFRVGDLTGTLPPGRFDAVVSGLAIHHLPHADKKILFRRIAAAIVPGGVFVNAEQVLAPTEEIEGMYDREHEAHVAASGTPAEEWAAGRERMKLDVCADVESQLGWLREAGFARVDCLAKDWRFATLAAWTAP